MLDFMVLKEDGGVDVGLRKTSCILPFVLSKNCYRGRHTKQTIQGAKASEIILEGFADKLADIIIKGEASIGDWDLERGTRINVNFFSLSCCHW